MVARGATLEALQMHGLRLHQGGQLTSQAVASSARPADVGVQDLVVLSVKAPSLPDVARHIAPLIGPDTMVLTAMNGVPWWFLQGFGGALAGTRLTSVDPRRRAGSGDTRAPSRRLRGACQLLGRCARAGASPLRQQADHRRAVGRTNCSRPAPCRAA